MKKYVLPALAGLMVFGLIVKTMQVIAIILLILIGLALVWAIFS